MLSPTCTTCDLYDAYGDQLAVCTSQFVSYGGQALSSGPAILVRCYADNYQVKRLLGEPGMGRVLVVDGGSSMSCALLGDLIAASAQTNGWAGIVVFGAVRDVAALADINLHIKALGHVPRKSYRRDQGVVLEQMECGGIWWHKGDWVYSDAEGLVVSRQKLAP